MFWTLPDRKGKRKGRKGGEKAPKKREGGREVDTNKKALGRRERGREER